jgi:hypothetical protein
VLLLHLPVAARKKAEQGWTYSDKHNAMGIPTDPELVADLRAKGVPIPY